MDNNKEISFFGRVADPALFVFLLQKVLCLAQVSELTLVLLLLGHLSSFLKRQVFELLLDQRGAADASRGRGLHADKLSALRLASGLHHSIVH